MTSNFAKVDPHFWFVIHRGGFCHYDGSAHGDGNKKQPKGG